MIRALQGDALWLEQLAHSKIAVELKVHSVFEHAMNLKDAQDNLYALVTQETMLAPHTIQLACHSMSTLGLDVGNVLRCSAQGISWHIAEEDFHIDLKTALPWFCILPAYHELDHADAIAQINQLLIEEKYSYGVCNAFTESVDAVLNQLHMDFLNAWQDDDVVLMRSALDKSIGLGVGLTPSGDDALVGLLALLSLQGSPVQNIRPLFEEVIFRAKGRTTDVSYSALLHASHRQFNQKLTECVTALFESDVHALEQKLRAVLSIGSTSGADMLHGVKTGLMMFNKRRISNVH